MAMIRVTPKAGARVRDPFIEPPSVVPAEGKLVEDDPYWRRRERDGDLSVSAATAAKKKKKET